MAVSASSQRCGSSSHGGLDLAQLPACRGEPAERGPHGLAHLRRHRRVGELGRQHADHRNAGAGGRGTGSGPAMALQQGNAVGGGRGERARVVQARRQREHPVRRHQAVGRLEADDAAVGGGDADRAAGVGADRQVADAGGDQRGRPAGRAARGPGRIARVAGVADVRVREAGGELQALRRWRTPRRRPRAAGRPAGRRRRRAPSLVAGLPHRVGSPATAMMSLTATGRPDSGPGRGPARRAGHRDDGVERPAQPVEPLVGGEQVQVLPAAGPLAPLDRGDQLGGPAEQEPRQRAEDRLGLGLAVPDRQVAVDRPSATSPTAG